jgi:N-acetylglucosamine-6-phosphate deacetylase
MLKQQRALRSDYIFDGVNLLTDKVILLAANKIIDLIDHDQVPVNLDIEDYGCNIISPGMLDLQLNGCGGVLFNAAISLETLETMHQCNLKFGTMGYLPTLITAPFGNVLQALEVIKQWFGRYGNQRGVLGLHLEGPFISREKRGIHPSDYVLSPTNELLAQIVAYSKYFPIKMTIAPECFTLAQINYLLEHKIVVALGHSNASYDQAASAFKQGVSAVTHMFNAMSGMSARNPGVVAASIAMAPYMGIIADLVHVDAANINLLSQLKPDSIYLVTDAVTPTGTTLRKFDFAGKHLWVREGKCVDEHGTLGGAYLTLNQAVRNCVNFCSIPISQALSMATLVPARLIGLDKELGRIARGYRANLMAIDIHDFSCQIIAGS